MFISKRQKTGVLENSSDKTIGYTIKLCIFA